MTFDFVSAAVTVSDMSDYTFADLASGRLDNPSRLYKTAQARIACAHFPVGRFVSVEFSHRDNTGTTWYLIHKTDKGPLPYPVAYPAHHLMNFCF